MAEIVFYGEVYEISIDEFLRSCDNSEKNKLRLKLNKGNSNNISISEQIFEEHLSALHGNWNRLTSDEEEQIMKICNKFK